MSFEKELNSAYAEKWQQSFARISDQPGPDTNKPPLNVLLLADNRHPANVVRDHINGFRLHSHHRIFVVNPIWEKIDECCDLERIDLILIHYSILILGDYFLPSHNADIVQRFKRPKAQIIQDECRWVNRMKERMAELGVSAVFSSLNLENMGKVYEGAPLQGMNFFSCLPGYIPEHFGNLPTLPIAQRKIDVVYRGRDLPFWLGRQSQEKAQIGRQMVDLCEKFGLIYDIESKENERIYGDDWQHFIASGRATLGVEGGVSIFDFDESVESRTQKLLADHPNSSFEDAYQKVLHAFEGNVVHRTITPRIFEAIGLRTALILYPGAYSGILLRDRHYIPFEPDGSNADVVAAKLKDWDYLAEISERTYSDIITRADLSSNRFVTSVDGVLEEMFRKPADLAQRPTSYQGRKLNVLLLCSNSARQTNTVEDHINAFEKFSRFNVHAIDSVAAGSADLNVSLFDVIVFHYSIVISLDAYIGPRLRTKLRSFSGPKILFIQDEFRWVDRTTTAAKDLGISVLFTVVNEDVVRKIYRDNYFDNVRFEHTLTGFVSETLLDIIPPRYEDRAVDIGYRARKLPAWCGSFAIQKWEIGEVVRKRARQLGFVTDISFSESTRIYGTDWIDFLCSCKATLGTESGSSFVDFTGEVYRRVDEFELSHPNAPFEVVCDKFLEGRDGEIVIHVISPRVFEAAALRTLMIMYPGSYSDVLQPGEHYLELKRDHSNLDEILEILRAPDEVNRITERAYRDIASSRNWTRQAFIQHFDQVVVEEARKSKLAPQESVGLEILIEKEVIRTRTLIDKMYDNPLSTVRIATTLYGLRQRAHQISKRFVPLRIRRIAKKILGPSVHFLKASVRKLLLRQ